MAEIGEAADATQAVVTALPIAPHIGFKGKIGVPVEGTIP